MVDTDKGDDYTSDHLFTGLSISGLGLSIGCHSIAAGPSSAFQHGARFFDLFMHDRVVEFVGTRTRDHDDIARFGKKVLVCPEYFAHQSLNSIPSHRVAHLLCYRNSESPALLVGSNQEYEVFGMNPLAVLLNTKILEPSANAVISPESVLLRGLDILILFLGHAKPRRWGGFQNSRCAEIR